MSSEAKKKPKKVDETQVTEASEPAGCCGGMCGCGNGSEGGCC